MSDIRLNKLDLENLIFVLEKENEEIDAIIKNMNLAIKTLDKNKWNSKEKSQMDEKFLPYMNKVEMQILPYLNDCTKILRESSRNYREVDQSNKKIIEDITNSNLIDII